MVTPLRPPARPLTTGRAWTWHPSSNGSPDPNDPDQASWIRFYHQGRATPRVDSARAWGPVHRFDHHLADADAGDRTLIALARALRTALAEVVGDRPEAEICPNHKVALVRVEADCRVQDLTGPGSTDLGAVQALGIADLGRALTQEWARAIHDDQPAGPPIVGVRYNSAKDLGLCLALTERAPRLRQTDVDEIPDGGLPVLEIAGRVRTMLAEMGVRFREVTAGDCRECAAAGMTPGPV